MAERDLTKLTVYLTDEALDAMNRSAATAGDSRTDTVNRALILYAAVLDVAKSGGGALSFDADASSKVHLRVEREGRGA